MCYLTFGREPVIDSASNLHPPGAQSKEGNDEATETPSELGRQ